MKTYSVQFVIAGTKQLRSGIVTSKNKNAVAKYINLNYGYCEYLVINEL